MDQKSLAYAHYWRNSLADAELGRGALSKGDIANFLPLRWAGRHGVADEEIVKQCFANEADDVKHVDVMIRPRVYASRLEHGKEKRTGAPQFTTPLVTSALLARDGRLYPQAGTVIPRDLLDPLERGMYTVGALEELDRFLGKDAVPQVEVPMACDEGSAEHDRKFDTQWLDYQSGCQKLLDAVCPGWPAAHEGFDLMDYGYLVKKQSVTGASQHILKLYDHIVHSNADAPLFDRYAGEQVDAPEPCLDSLEKFSARLGHANDSYPLAAAQRDALTHLMASGAGEILAVNGPPGTGKTTLLLSVVASLWARSALAGEAPPVIVAASTNNQAVTNIIDAFGKDFAPGSGPFSGRWLPDIHSYGAYFPSASRLAEAAKYQTQLFFNSVENASYVAQAKDHYLAAARLAFPGSSVDCVQTAVDTVQQCLLAEAAKLRGMESSWRQLVQARKLAADELGEDPEKCQADREARARQLDEACKRSQQLADDWEAYLANESLLYTLFAWLPPVAKKRMQRAALFIKKAAVPQLQLQDWQSIAQIETALRTLTSASRAALQKQQARVEHGAQLLRGLQAGRTAWKDILAPLGLHGPSAEDTALNEADKLADTRIRFPIFHLAAHYWEGRWLLEMEKLLPDLEQEPKKRGASALKSRWQRRMMLTPCIVSTFHMLPSLMKVRRKDGSNFVDDYLYGFADLLIVDEAGQVLPEVAGASFALAKTALVIGDTLQIEPIWSVPRQVDVGNLASAGLLQPREGRQANYDELSEGGKMAASGSVMRIAQNASRWHYDADLSRGLYLYEHRRCFDEIIGYCNALSYHGKLLPMRGGKLTASPKMQDGLPPLGYLHVDGICESGAGGSKRNMLEAEVIAAWLTEQRPRLETHYGMPLADIVAVVTPFSGQVRAISAACQAAGIRIGKQNGEMTVGTVHALQGAERPVVIFSSVYSKHADGPFIDKSSSMLNVAVSRAKNAFLVFGDMDTYSQAHKGSPRGQLAHLLFAAASNALEFPHRPRQDLVTPRQALRQLLDADEHDTFLRETLANAQRQVHIVTPWIRPGCMEETGMLDAMSAAVQRGVAVRVYTDKGSNLASQDPAERSRKELHFESSLASLRRCGIESVVVRMVHSKIVIGDEDVYCVGSFNWFSARRNEAAARHETSLVYHGPNIRNEILVMQQSLEQRRTKS